MKPIFKMITAVMLVCVLTISALAADTGSISVTLNTSGGSVTVYRVAEAQDGKWSYLAPFHGGDADQLAQQTQNAAGTKQNVADGTVRFDALEQGLYLVVQSGEFSNGETFAPFLVSLPDADGNLTVDATPKMSLKPTPSPNPTPTPTPGKKLPQTGQLWWPVPVLAFVGLVSFAIGWLRKKHDA